MSRLDNPGGKKGIVWGPFEPFEKRNPSRPEQHQRETSPGTSYLASQGYSRTKVPVHLESRDDASPLFVPRGANGGKFNDQRADDVDS